MPLPRSRAHYPQRADIEQFLSPARLTEVIDTPFVRCPNPGCDHGWIEHFDCANATRWYSLCPECDGMGRIMVQTEPDFVPRIRNWWKRNQEPVEVGLKFAALCILGAVLLYLWGWLRAIVGLLEWRP